MRIPGLSGIAWRHPSSSHNHLTEISPVNDGLIEPKCKRA